MFYRYSFTAFILDQLYGGDTILITEVDLKNITRMMLCVLILSHVMYELGP